MDYVTFPKDVTRWKSEDWKNFIDFISELTNSNKN